MNDRLRHIPPGGVRPPELRPAARHLDRFRDLPPPRLYRFVNVSFFDFFGSHHPLSRDQLRQCLDLERHWPLHMLPEDMADGGYLRAFVWCRYRPTPTQHWHETTTRLPFLEALPDTTRSFFSRNARAQLEKYDGNRTNRCPFCGSQLLGFSMMDHPLESCQFAQLRGDDRLRFLAINSVSYCQRCNSRSAFHSVEECEHERAQCYLCKSHGHTAASGLCHDARGRDTEEARRTLQEDFNRFRREHYTHMRNLLASPHHPLAYRTHADYPYGTLRVWRRQRQNERFSGLGFYVDDRQEFPRPPNASYYNQQHGWPVGYVNLVPPELNSQRQQATPLFTEEVNEYLNALADIVTTAKTVPGHLETVQLPHIDPLALHIRPNHRLGWDEEPNLEVIPAHMMPQAIDQQQPIRRAAPMPPAAVPGEREEEPEPEPEDQPPQEIAQHQPILQAAPFPIPAPPVIVPPPFVPRPRYPSPNREAFNDPPQRDQPDFQRHAEEAALEFEREREQEAREQQPAGDGERAPVDDQADGPAQAEDQEEKPVQAQVPGFLGFGPPGHDEPPADDAEEEDLELEYESPDDSVWPAPAEFNASRSSSRSSWMTNRSSAADEGSDTFDELEEGEAPREAIKKRAKERRVKRGEREMQVNVMNQCSAPITIIRQGFRVTARAQFQKTAFEMLTETPLPSSREALAIRIQTMLKVLTGHEITEKSLTCIGTTAHSLLQYYDPLIAVAIRLSNEPLIITVFEDKNAKMATEKTNEGADVVTIPSYELFDNHEDVRQMMRTLASSKSALNKIKKEPRHFFPLRFFVKNAKQYHDEARRYVKFTENTPPHPPSYEYDNATLERFMKQEISDASGVINLTTRWILTYLTGSEGDIDSVKDYQDALHYSILLKGALKFILEIRRHNKTIKVSLSGDIGTILYSPAEAHLPNQVLWIPEYKTFKQHSWNRWLSWSDQAWSHTARTMAQEHGIEDGHQDHE